MGNSSTGLSDVTVVEIYNYGEDVIGDEIKILNPLTNKHFSTMLFPSPGLSVIDISHSELATIFVESDVLFELQLLNSTGNIIDYAIIDVSYWPANSSFHLCPVGSGYEWSLAGAPSFEAIGYCPSIEVPDIGIPEE